MLNQKLMGSYPEKLYVDDVFSTYLYTGNGSTQTINNGIDLAGEGGLAWIKGRTDGSMYHVLTDSQRGLTKTLATNTTEAQRTEQHIGSFNTDGFTLANGGWVWSNTNGQPYVSWTFRKAPKFFDVVTYTGDGTSNRQIAHELGIAPGFITTKATSTTGDWNSYHRSATGDLKLNLTNAQTASRAIITAATESTFTVSGVANTNGVSYVAYLWAHDPSEDGIIQCGSFTTDASGNATVNLGWEPQFVMRKTSSTIGGWQTYDAMRGMAVGGNNAFLNANESASEYSEGAQYMRPSATGFSLTGVGASTTYIYLAIRRPNKPPKTGAEVYNAGTNSYVYTGWPVDLNVANARSDGSQTRFVDRLRGYDKRLVTSSTASEATSVDPNAKFDNMYQAGVTESGSVVYAFRRAPGFFDVVCYTGTGIARTVPHNLGAVPELMIVKQRSGSNQWNVYHIGLQAPAIGRSAILNENTTPQGRGAGAWNNTVPTDSMFSLGTDLDFNASGQTYVWYGFATLPGISKVGSYTGNGSSQTIDCGFTTGARFILIKRTDSPGDWYVWDTARGIIAANDPHLSLNTTAAEVTTDDSVDPAATGFIVNQNTATNINVNDASYIFLAIA